ncbi:MAG TPA: hypothetical protein VGA59_00375 [Ramlibacter sp.]|jgi:hypothetical protein
MRLLIESAIIFFGTLMAAALVALSGPAIVDLVTGQATPSQAATQVLASSQPRDVEATSAPRPGR